MKNLKEQIGELAIIHYQARKEINRLKLERGKIRPLLDEGETWINDDHLERKKVTDMMWAFSKKGRIARYKMTCLIKKISCK